MVWNTPLVSLSELALPRSCPSFSLLLGEKMLKKHSSDAWLSSSQNRHVINIQIHHCKAKHQKDVLRKINSNSDKSNTATQSQREGEMQ